MVLNVDSKQWHGEAVVQDSGRKVTLVAKRSPDLNEAYEYLVDEIKKSYGFTEREDEGGEEGDGGTPELFQEGQ